LPDLQKKETALQKELDAERPNLPPKQITRDLVHDIVMELTGIKKKLLSMDPEKSARRYRGILMKDLYGQEEAIRIVSGGVRTLRAVKP